MNFDMPKQTQTAIIVENPLEEYGDLDTMLHMEHLDENINEVLEQVHDLRDAMDVYRQHLEKYTETEDKQDYYDLYVWPAQEHVNDILRTFSINGKRVNLLELFSETDVEKNVTELILSLNDYIEYFMIGQNVQRIQHI